MAFTPKTVGGNIVADGNGGSFFTYETLDTKAVVVTAGYFKSVDVDGQLTSGESTADMIFAKNDLLMVKCADGLFLGGINVSTPTTVSIIAKLNEA